MKQTVIEYSHRSERGERMAGGGKSGADYAAVIRGRRKAAGLSQEELAALLGVSRNTLAGWETGHSRPDLDRVPGLCRALKMSLNAFFGLRESRSAGENRVLEKFFRLEEGDREVIEWQMEALAQRREEKLREETLARVVAVWRSDLSAAAGTGFLLDESRGEEMFLLRDPETEQADEVIAVNGDSMAPAFLDGERVLVQHTGELKPGEIGVFLVDGEGYIKEYRKDGLHSLNPAYRTMTFDGEQDVRCVGRVIGKLKDSQIPTEKQMRILEEAGKAGRRKPQ